MNRAFGGTSIYKSEDLPEIDRLLISHDHWDHLDYHTIMALRPKVKQVICPLGVGAYFEYWGFAKEMIYEGDWNETIEMDKDFAVHLLSARHYSARPQGCMNLERRYLGVNLYGTCPARFRLKKAVINKLRLLLGL